MTKVCTSCKEERELSRFAKQKSGIRSVCKPCVNLKAKARYYENKDKILVSRKSHNVNRENRRKWYNEWERKKKGTDPKFRLIKSIRLRHNSVLKGKLSTTQNLGCTRDELRDHIESLWKEGMDWLNYGFGAGKWCIDHIKPLSLMKKDLSDAIDFIHYTNLQPMWFEENNKKGNKF